MFNRVGLEVFCCFLGGMPGTPQIPMGTVLETCGYVSGPLRAGKFGKRMFSENFNPTWFIFNPKFNQSM